VRGAPVVGTPAPAAEPPGLRAQASATILFTHPDGDVDLHMDQHTDRLHDGAPPRGVPRDVRGLAAAGPSATETWLRIVQVHDRITHRVDSALHRQHGLSLTGFEVLRRVAEAPEEWASMGDLAEAVGLSRPGITSTVNRLVDDGLVTRERLGEDRRLLHARLTDAGRERVRAATATHDDLVAHLLTMLGDDASVVTDALARVSAATRRPRA
jgi:DNA-binding MarR family transcriptional regulator